MTSPTSISVLVANKRVRLPLWDDAESDSAENKARSIGRSFDECPTCKGRRIDTDSDDHHGWINGQYRYRGEIHECDCKGQMALFRHYLWANIPMQYMRLNWADFDGDLQVRNDITRYIENWRNFRDNGMGVTLFGEKLGTGKTFAATTIAKGVLKRGERVYFTEFRDLRTAYQILSPQEQQDLDRRTREAALLILDEVTTPTSDAQGAFFGNVLEMLIRHRTNWDLPTVITTNLSEEEIQAHFPRVYSLLNPKQWTMHMDGDDQRQSRIAKENIELAASGEVRPII